MGKLLVFRSGAVKLQLGNVLLDVTACGEAGIQQEVVCINAASAERGQGNAQEGAAIFLGGLHHRVVASPDITQLLECVSSWLIHHGQPQYHYNESIAHKKGTWRRGGWQKVS